jgi:hypothetical protein
MASLSGQRFCASCQAPLRILRCVSLSDPMATCVQRHTGHTGTPCLLPTTGPRRTSLLSLSPYDRGSRREAWLQVRRSYPDTRIQRFCCCAVADILFVTSSREDNYVSVCCSPYSNRCIFILFVTSSREDNYVSVCCSPDSNRCIFIRTNVTHLSMRNI